MVPITLQIVFNGFELMDLPKSNLPNLPDSIIPDMNMREKLGVDRLFEVRTSETLKNVLMIRCFSSFIPQLTNLPGKKGIPLGIRKLDDFPILKSFGDRSVSFILTIFHGAKKKEGFVIQS